MARKERLVGCHKRPKSSKRRDKAERQRVKQRRAAIKRDLDILSWGAPHNTHALKHWRARVDSLRRELTQL